MLLPLPRPGMPERTERALSVANIVLTILFTVEMGMKLVGLGFWDYVRDMWNLFDAVIVSVSLLEIFMTTAGGMNALRSMRALRILRALRVLRLFKLFKYISSLRKIGEVMVNSFASFFAIGMLLVSGCCGWCCCGLAAV